MPHVIVMMLVPMVPVTCLALVLWLDRLEETLERDVDRRREQAAAPEAQLEASLAGVSASPAPAVAPASAVPAPVVPPAVGGPDISLGGSTNR
jgi:hypothetical protein